MKIVIVRWRWTSDDPKKIRIEEFLSVASAKRWIKGFIRRKRQGEDAPILIDTSFDRESNPSRRSIHTAKWDRCVKDVSARGGEATRRITDHIVSQRKRESNPARHEIKLWRYDPITGYWRVAQGPFDSAEVAAQYLAIFQKDEPEITFKLSTKRPPYPESSRKRNPARSSLERESSWVIVNRQTGEPILETFQKSVADKVNTKKYEVVPILRWLQRVNRKAREK